MENGSPGYNTGCTNNTAVNLGTADTMGAWMDMEASGYFRGWALAQ